MAHILVDVSGIGVLSSENLPAGLPTEFYQTFGTANPFKDAIEFLDKTSGRFWHEFYVLKSSLMNSGDRRTYRGNGRAFLQSLVSAEHGASFITPDMYISPEFRPKFLPLASVAAGFALFSTLGLYFEVIKYPMYVTLDDTAYQQDVPSYLPEATYIDENEQVVNRTWAQWHAPNSNHRTDANGNHIMLSSMTGNWLAGSILIQLYSAGFTLGYAQDFPVTVEE